MRSALAGARRVVIKVGSRLLAESPAGRPAAIADQVVALRAQGVEVVLVSSGAIALGVRALGLGARPTELPALQAAAATGQSRLMQHWEHAFAVHGVVIGQVLLTHDDLGDRRRFLSARHTLRALVDLGAVPIINENDTVATEEIKFGDNDQLAALVCNLVSADLLIILTDVEGVRGADGQRLSTIADGQDLTGVIKPPTGDGVGSGGMASKVASARLVTRTGVPCVIAPGRLPDVALAVTRGDDVGTLFQPGADVLSSRKHWIAYGAKPGGRLLVDGGAARARSPAAARACCPPAITAVEGGFGLGETVSRHRRRWARARARPHRLRAPTTCAGSAGLHSGDIAATLGTSAAPPKCHPPRRSRASCERRRRPSAASSAGAPGARTPRAARAWPGSPRPRVRPAGRWRPPRRRRRPAALLAMADGSCEAATPAILAANALDLAAADARRHHRGPA
jgi:glutamate 5-kinase